ncbi:DUF1501 domain-containing protein [Desulfovibrio inopinatus]|uniref:DUF1501 domain-containing protein n=1 Tax=Desulfovibrio inopinatus TaxID=102109 RepID=UPI0003F662F6|nr:DUF1501 domain-containing protein [Desulfovibrio inopinatus]
MNRRECLAFLAGCGAATLLPHQAVASGNTAARFIVVFLRGGVDALSVLVPYTDPWYPVYRPTTSVPPPGSRHGGIDLDGTFALHPALAGLRRFWDAGQFAFIPCAGIPILENNHQKAQRNLETGMPGNVNVKDGWLNRCAAELGTPKGKYGLIALSRSTPFIVRGRERVRVLGGGSSRYDRPETRLPRAYWALDRVYPRHDDLATAYHQGVVDRKRRLRHIGREMAAANDSAPTIDSFKELAVRLAKEMTKHPEYRIGFLHFGGFDTHIDQGGKDGLMQRQLAATGEGLVALANGLGGLFEQTVVVVVSEFGRSARENDLGGTGNGHGGLVWLLGGPVVGGRVFGRFPGLAAEYLFENRDLPVLTDLRDVIVPILTRHMMFDAHAVATVFPGFTSSNDVEGIVKVNQESKKMEQGITHKKQVSP